MEVRKRATDRVADGPVVSVQMLTCAWRMCMAHLDLVQELGHPRAVDAAHRHRIAQPELEKLGGQRVP